MAPLDRPNLRIVGPDYSAPRFVPLHRGVRPIPVRDLHAIFDGRIDLHDAFAETLQREPYRPSTFERVCNWLGETFGESPRGFAFIAGLLLPLCIAAFCIGYFGLRELIHLAFGL